MKASITLKSGRIFSGELESIDSSRICIDLKNLKADEVNALHEANIPVTRINPNGWYIIARFLNIEKYEITD